MFRRLISRALLLMMLVTLLSPHFAWEAAAPEHHHALATADEAAHGEHGLPDADHHDEHACAGHMASHLPGQIGVIGLEFAPPAAVRERVPRTAGTPCGVADAPYRPPRTPSFA